MLATPSLRKDSPLHSRDPRECKQSKIPPVRWSCPGCQEARPNTLDRYQNSKANDPDHTYEVGECRFSDHHTATRVGAHPRDARPKATAHPSAEASSYDAAGDEPSVRGNVPLAFRERGDVLPQASSSSSSRPPARGTSNPQDTSETYERGLDGYQHIKRTWASTGSGASRLPDWTRFNIQISLRNLKSFEPAVVQKEMRKLHLRWWHAKEPKMRQILSAAGIDEARLGFIKPVVDTCRECRAWQKGGNVVMSSIDITTAFHEKGETDLMFHKGDIGFHVIDRAIRLSDGCEVSDQESETILNAYATTWVQRHGPFKILYSDGEKGLDNPSSIAELKRLGTDLRVRPPGQHANLAEARQSMLRHVMHMIEEELKRQGTSIPFSRLYAEAIFVVKNTFDFPRGKSILTYSLQGIVCISK